MIRDILNHDDYKNITGLHEAISHHLEKQDQQGEEEDVALKAEEDEVESEETLLETHPCPCIWGQWEDWGECTVTCGGGTKTRQRPTAQIATNGGDECEGRNFEDTSCNRDACRKSKKLSYLKEHTKKTMNFSH